MIAGRKILKLPVGEVLMHILFWILSYMILLGLFQLSSKTQPIDYIYTTLFHITLVMAVYVNLLWLVHFLREGRYVIYLLLAITNMLVFSFLNMSLFSGWIDHLLPGYYFISYYDLSDILKFHAAYIVLTTMLQMSKEWFILLRSKKEVAELEKEKTGAELTALKAQINPHFLMNTLNNIYSLALENSKATAEFILKLSEIFRYMLYEAKDDSVPLEREVEIIREYISLLEIRAHPGAEISIEVEGNIRDHRIAPLLLIPLVENSFKHGIKGEESSDSYLHLRVEAASEMIRFVISNNKGEVDEVEIKREGGLGIENVRRRLELQYPGHHHFSIEETAESFTVILELYKT